MQIIATHYLPIIKKSMEQYVGDKRIDGLLFKYKHFYGSYDYVGTSYHWYRNEIRIVRNNKNIYSYRDAQGFRKDDDKKLNVKPIDAYVYHYGWVKDPFAMQRKQEDFNKLWHDEKWIEENVQKADKFDYSNIDSLSLFTETHPKVMLERIARLNWKFDYDLSCNKTTFKDKVKAFFEKIGLPVGQYRNYKIIK